MKKIDYKHIAFHVLIALYFIWLLVFVFLVIMANLYIYGPKNYNLANIFSIWILFNLVMGSALFIVIRMFRKKGRLANFIVYSYWIMAAACIGTVVLVKINV